MEKQKTINEYFNRVKNIKEFILRSKTKYTDIKTKSFLICLENYSYRLEGYILGTYNSVINNEELSLSLDTKSILLRGCIEAYLLSNIIINTDENVAFQFYEKGITDFQYIKSMYGSAVNIRYNNVDNVNKIVRSDRFSYIGNNDNYPNSLVELVDYSFLDENTKTFLKYWIKVCDSTVHPSIESYHEIDNYFKFKNNDLYDDIFGENGVISILDKLVINDLIKLNSLLELSINNTDLEIKEYIEVYNINNIEFNEVNDIVDLINKEQNTDKQHVLKVLFSEFSSNYEDLIFAVNNNRKYLFHIKVRFIIEFISIFYLLLNKESGISKLFKLHNLILSKDLVELMVKYYKQINKVNGINTSEKAYLLKYEENLNKIKAYYLKKNPDFDINKLKNQIKHTNGWAIGLIDNKDKAPKTLELIKYTLKELLNNIPNEFADKYQINDYIIGLYVESCEYSHITSFSISEVFKSFEEEKNELFFVLKIVLNSLFLCIKNTYLE